MNCPSRFEMLWKVQRRIGCNFQEVCFDFDLHKTDDAECVCVCVSQRKREREKKVSEREREREGKLGKIL